MPSTRSVRILARAASPVILAGLLAGLLYLIAYGAASPDTAISEARCYRNISETGDLLCLGRYELDQQTSTGTPSSAEAWCQYLQDTTGCTSSPVNPSSPASLQYGITSAWVTLCSLAGGQTGCAGGSTSSSGTVYKQNQVPRIHHGLAGIYLAGGHGIAWDTSTVNMCIESTDDFDPIDTACSGTVVWNSAANNQGAQRTQLAADLKSMLAALETSRGVPRNSYVQSGKITAAGAVLSREAYAFIERVIPDAFQAAAEQTVLTPYSGTPAGVVILQTRIAATEIPRFMPGADEAGKDILGVSGGFLKTLIFMTFGVFAALAVYGLTSMGGREPSMAMTVITFGMVTSLGMFVGGPTLSAVMVSIVILALLAGWFILTRAPS